MSRKNLIIVLIGCLLFLGGVLGFITNDLKDSGVCVVGIGIIGLVLIWTGIRNEQYVKTMGDFQTLSKKLKHKDVAVRYNAVQALGALKDPRAIDSLIIALDDEDFRVQQVAADALSLTEGLDLEQTQILKEWFEHHAGSPITALHLIHLEVSDCTLMENGDVLINPNRNRGIFAMILGLSFALVSLWMLSLLIADLRGSFNISFIVMLVLLVLGGILLYVGIHALIAPEISFDVASRSIHVRTRGLQSAQTRPFDAITGSVNVTTLGLIAFSLVHVSLRFDDSKSLSLFMTGDKTKTKRVIRWLETVFKTNDVGYIVDEKALNDDVKKVLKLIKALDTPDFPIFLPEGDIDLISSSKATYEKALDSIVAIGISAVEPLTFALHHPNLNLRLGAIEALGRIGDSGAIDSIRAVIQETNSTERAYAVRALGKAGRSDVLGEIIPYLNDSDVKVREAAVSALEEIGDPRALPELELLVNTDTVMVDRFGPSVGELANKAIMKIHKSTGK